MDGGGRVAEPLGAGPSGFAVGRSDSAILGTEAPARRFTFPFLSAGVRRRRSFVTVPLRRRLPRFVGTGLLAVFFGATGAYGLVASGQYDALRAVHGEPRDVLARAFGFGVDTVMIAGLSQLTEREVLLIGGITDRGSLPFLNAADVRDRLERKPLIRSASVRKVYPNELAVTLTEREPFAIWQRNGELSLVAADGTVIDRYDDARFAFLPLVVGEGANLRAASYAALLEAAGPLRPRIRAGMLVSGRRWTLKMDNGLDVKLPEEGAPAAVARLARLERDSRILDRDVLSLDLRMADRIVVRLTEEAAAARAEAGKKKPVRGAKGVET